MKHTIDETSVCPLAGREGSPQRECAVSWFVLFLTGASSDVTNVHCL